MKTELFKCLVCPLLLNLSFSLLFPPCVFLFFSYNAVDGASPSSLWDIHCVYAVSDPQHSQFLLECLRFSCFICTYCPISPFPLLSCPLHNSASPTYTRGVKLQSWKAAVSAGFCGFLSAAANCRALRTIANECPKLLTRTETQQKPADTMALQEWSLTPLPYTVTLRRRSN